MSTFDALPAHVDHDLIYVEAGIDHRRVRLEGEIAVVGKSYYWEVNDAEIHCATCGRDLHIDPAMMEYET